MRPRNLLVLGAVVAGAFVFGSLTSGAVGAPDQPVLALTDLLGQDMRGPQREHKFLHKFVGSWDVVNEMHMPNMAPMESKGKLNARMVCNGTWLLSEFEGDMMGVTYHGMAIQGYNPEKRKFVGAWFDMAKTDFDVLEGMVDEATDALTSFGEMPDPFRPGQTTRVKTAFTFPGKDRIVYNEYLPKGEGGWKLWLKMECSRAKEHEEPGGEHRGDHDG